MSGWKRFLKDERALEISEYAVALSLLVAALVVVLASLAGSIAGVLARVVDVLGP